MQIRAYQRIFRNWKGHINNVQLVDIQNTYACFHATTTKKEMKCKSMAQQL